ncbi:MAG: flavin reductase [Bacteroidales bacterium]|nr:flavin reductase [Bacteroidales bacterium]
MKHLILLAIAALTLASCTQSTQNQSVIKAKTVKEATETQWQKTDIKDLTINPFTQLSNDWMLLATGNCEDNNAMTIAWGGFGMLWGKPVVTVYVSCSRYTWDMLNKNPYFTVTAFPADGKEFLQYMGSNSKRDVKDKAAACGLHTEFTPDGHPIYAEANLAIECKKIYQQPLDSTAMPEEIFNNMYANGKMGIHYMYIGEVENVFTK